MQNKQTYKIYTTNLSSDTSQLIEIETIILNGLYRFSILGVNQKSSSDIKDRVYSALRSQKLMNLKSDNKKITVNLLPTNIDKKTNIYDLGIALSCLVHMNQIELNENILATGELSIVGNLIPSNYILKSIYQAIENNIKCIICSQNDIEILNIYPNNLNYIINKNKLKFIVANNLGELIQNIKNNSFYTFKNNNEIITKVIRRHIDLNNENIFKIILAICTNRNIFIENRKDSYIKKFLKNLIYYTNRLNDFEILNISNILSKPDHSVLDMFTYPKMSIIDSQTQKDDLLLIVNESLFGFNLIENFISIPQDILYTTKKLHKSSIICFYNSCPCGNSNNLFISIQDDKCICLQRHILRYRQKILVLENGFFDFYIQNINNDILEYKQDDYVYINEIISNFRNQVNNINQIEVMDQISTTLKNYYEKAELDIIINLAKDIAMLKYILDETKKPMVLKDTIDLAVKFLKKGF
ncbi:hypothetical protein H7Y21_04135 [Arenimonas sp.]|nr:hypothetical protein [Candidatus Parcubacteria bacterium]